MPIKAEGRRLCNGCHTSLQRLSIVQWVSHFPSQATDCAVADALPFPPGRTEHLKSSPEAIAEGFFSGPLII